MDKENYFIWCGLYNELNPLRADIVEHPKDWKYSSFRFYGDQEVNFLIKELIDVDPYYLELSPDPKRRKQIYLDNIVDNIDKMIKENYLKYIRNKLDSGIFGRSDFIKKMKEKFDIGSLKKRGRPKKIQS